MKYIKVMIWPTKIKGVSTGHAPIHVKRTTRFSNVHRRILLMGKNWMPLILLFLIMGIKIKIAIDITRAITPPNLLGIDRRMAYANKKYHSGWMWMGVTNGFAGMKFSVSPSILGYKRTNILKAHVIIINP